MGVQKLEQSATEQVSINITFDATGVPQTASAQKELVDDQGNVTPDGGVVVPVISESAKKNFADALLAAQGALEAQVIAENFPNGDFAAYVEPVPATTTDTPPGV